jgi:monoamine oxidase
VVTLPLGVWQAPPRSRGAVQFVPELRAKRKLARAIGVSHVIRLQLRFDRRKWQSLLPAPLRTQSRSGFGFVHSRVTGVPVWWALSGEPVVTGWAGGPAAKALVTRSRSAIFEKATASLSEMLGVTKSAVRDAVLDWETHNWSRDPFSRGAYSYVTAGNETAAAKLREPVQNTLFFAGEATADGEEVGTVHGALGSGLRAAAEVREAISG